MKQLLIQFGVIYVLLSILMVGRPWLSRKNVLFGVVFGGVEIWKRNDIRKIINRFLLSCIGIAILGAVYFIIVLNATKMNTSDVAQFYSVTLFVFILLEIIPYIIANHNVKKLKPSIPGNNLVRDKITVEIGGNQNKQPLSVAWFLLLLIPIIMTIVVAVIYYSQMPLKIPMHFNAGGIVDSWGNKSISVVLSPVFHQILIAAFFFIIGVLTRNAPASVKGNPGAAPGYPSFRRTISSSLIAIALTVELNFLAIEFLYAGVIQGIRVPVVIILILTIAITIFLIIAFFKHQRSRVPTGPVLDDDSKWIFGILYFNPSDPSLFVEKRHGIGQTINFGRPVTWIIISVTILIIILNHILKS